MARHRRLWYAAVEQGGVGEGYSGGAKAAVLRAILQWAEIVPPCTHLHFDCSTRPFIVQSTPLGPRQRFRLVALRAKQPVADAGSVVEEGAFRLGAPCRRASTMRLDKQWRAATSTDSRGARLGRQSHPPWDAQDRQASRISNGFAGAPRAERWPRMLMPSSSCGRDCAWLAA
ncbi:hypothetical protein BU26DRAFT_299884 [Trematosphaeria pertusa]|uniref:Uncharacterized protein n=1 Tax=Trematosphaeria pertusa TaxID=390896 RepID=A0A6A6II73_9PLEO|nr:uncharacterized protein BU26DRAFT_299884 [Trematosphaeria pertusa]KAF2250315.1 hypothetical protein BU26DRAFT_299884 [Trematosphaeria pertusa]